MGKRITPENKVRQKTISFKSWQYDFMDENINFNPHRWCQDAIEAQIKLLVETGQADKKWLKFLV